MADYSGRDKHRAEGQPAPLLDCEQWESLLADKMDGTLAPDLESSFREHGHRCPCCAGLLEQAEQGRQWLKLLEEHAPAAPADLLSRILAKTQGRGHETDYDLGASGLAVPGVAAQGSAALPGRWNLPLLPPAGLLAARRAHSARMLMTAAMAFLSVALTLSLAGVGFNSVHAAELRPQVVQASVFRSFYGTKKQVVSFYENLRLVYEVESRMSSSSSQVPAGGSGTPAAGTTPKAPATASPGGSTRTGPALDLPGPGLSRPISSAPTLATAGSTRNSGSGRAAAGKQLPQANPVSHGMPLRVEYGSSFAAGMGVLSRGPRLVGAHRVVQSVGLAMLAEPAQGTQRKRI